MKKHKTLALFVFALIALSLLAVQTVRAQTTFTVCEGAFIPLGILDSGIWTYPGGNMHGRGIVSQYQQYMPTSDSRCNGLNTVVTNANWDAYGVGPSWGTFHVILEEESPDGWGGIWTGMSYPDGSTSIQVVGHGYGSLEGQQVFVNIAFPLMYAPHARDDPMAEPSSAQPASTFVIRFWREWSITTPRWRGRIEHVQSGQRTDFVDLESMMEFVRGLGVMADD
jgi:hypothetical protein